jgi:murein DD-endopeptidase MepM/ murein hydrolase activator NlpD
MAGAHLEYHWPLTGAVHATCEFGSRDKMHNDANHPHGHGGMDLHATAGTPVLASADGIVLHSGQAKGYGHWVVISHSDGKNTIYGHLSQAGLPSIGKKVTAGEVIGHVGTKAEGHTTGPHLHFQVNLHGIDSGHAINPRTIVTAPGVTPSGGHYPNPRPGPRGS